MTKGIILAGGLGSRLFPLTLGTSKQLLPVYDKPMIYYPLNTLISAKITDVLIISTTKDSSRFYDLLGDGSKFGIKISYEIQKYPGGIAEAFVIAEKFICNSSICLVLGDNIFHGDDSFYDKLKSAKYNALNGTATIFGVNVNNPKDFGVIEFDENKKIKQIIEKPKSSKSNLIVSGLYFYPNEVVKYAKKLKPSSRGELEITSVNNYFLSKNKLHLVKLKKDFFWSDTGTYHSLIEASNYFYSNEKKYSKKECCPEESAYKNGLIDLNKLNKISELQINSDYGKYLKKIVCENS